MGNVYILIEKNGELVEAPEDFDGDGLMVHRDKGFNRAVELWREGTPFEDLKNCFCEWCGNEIPESTWPECNCYTARLERWKAKKPCSTCDLTESVHRPHCPSVQDCSNCINMEVCRTYPNIDVSNCRLNKGRI